MEDIEIRKVWAHNIVGEFNLITSLLPQLPFISFDTEFPGTVYPPQNLHLPSSELYESVKKNVNATNIIQIGITLSNGKTHYVWEFNFKDFNLSRGDLHNPDSINMLRDQGIDFEKNAQEGIASEKFIYLMLCSGLLRNSKVTWVGFHTSYDFGYLIKMLNGGKLPDHLKEFVHAVRWNFGGRVYDIKHMMKECEGLYGGLERVAKVLGVERTSGKCHEAGSDSLLTLQTFFKMIPSCMIYGLELHYPHIQIRTLPHHQPQPQFRRVVYHHPPPCYYQLIRC
ncbi:hypothetical protein AQUCO_01600386v1 [Aquilegia coerulea]|uniref:poly(A)-specific ribonuclease n=1 Tax=Aquilegia coerulea TaxID=218851 RepID=A0A2G5DRD6_AQUCA|nr:hypothetical protein AQUCO_01600386v1 [Aquilegia coerulea]